MATVNLGSIKFKWKGTYAGGTAYTIDDVVSYNGSSYICILASTGNLPTNATYFEQMSSAGTNGTNGTDLTTTLTTQGDLVYRDGSGLQRLGAGTSGQVLQTGGAGANPSWTTMSSDVVKLSSNIISGNPTSITVDGYYDDTVYSHYKLVGSGLTYSTLSAGSPRLRFTYDNSGTPTEISSANYIGHFKWDRYDGTGGVFNGGNSGHYNGGAIEFGYDNWSLYTDFYITHAFEIMIWQPQNTTFKKKIQYWITTDNGSGGSQILSHGSSFLNDYLNTAITGIKLYNNAGNTYYTGGTITLYGYKK
jgi:hypothetical protein